MKISDRKDVWSEADTFLQDLELVERVQVRLGHQVKIWQLNLTGKSQKTLEMMVFKDLLKETIEVDFKLQGENDNCSGKNILCSLTIADYLPK